MDTDENNGHPQWYLDNYEVLQRFINLDEDIRGTLVGDASGMFMTTLISLTPDGLPIVSEIGKEFFNTTLTSIGEKLNGMSKEDILLLILGVAIQTIGIQEMKIQIPNVRTD